MSEQLDLPPSPMTVEEFCAWADAAPRGRFELAEGQPVAMAPERTAHVEAKAPAWLALRNAIRSAGLDCCAYVDGLAVRVDATTAYQPDALVNGGEPPARDALVAPNAVIVVEVTSPSTSRVDALDKFVAYLRVPSIHHHVKVDTVKRVVVHHQRVKPDVISSSIFGSGALTLDPPGITIEVEDLFPA